MWAAIAPLGRSAHQRRLLPPAVDHAGDRAARLVHRAVRGPRAGGRGRRQRQPARHLAGLDFARPPGGRAESRPRRRPDRLPPRLRPRRRRVRRPAGRGLLARGDRPAEGARRDARAAGGGRRLRRRGGLALRPGLPGLPAGDRCDDTARAAAELRDPTGTFLPDAMAVGGLRAGARAGPTGSTGSAASSSCTSSRAATSSTATRPIGLASAIWPHGRYRFDFGGEANHAGTTRMEDRHDPMLSYAMTALAAAQAGPSRRSARDLRAARGHPQRHERDPVARDRVARRPRGVGGVAGRAGRGDRAAGHRARRPRRHLARRSPRSRCRARSASTLPSPPASTRPWAAGCR